MDSLSMLDVTGTALKTASAAALLPPWLRFSDQLQQVPGRNFSCPRVTGTGTREITVDLEYTYYDASTDHHNVCTDNDDCSTNHHSCPNDDTLSNDNHGGTNNNSSHDDNRGVRVVRVWNDNCQPNGGDVHGSDGACIASGLALFFCCCKFDCCKYIINRY